MDQARNLDASAMQLEGVRQDIPIEIRGEFQSKVKYLTNTESLIATEECSDLSRIIKIYTLKQTKEDQVRIFQSLYDTKNLKIVSRKTSLLEKTYQLSFSGVNKVQLFLQLLLSGLSDCSESLLVSYVGMKNNIQHSQHFSRSSFMQKVEPMVICLQFSYLFVKVHKNSSEG